MPTSEHTAKAFDQDLQEITRLVAEMGGLAERQIADSVDALVRRDVASAAASSIAMPSWTVCSARSRNCPCSPSPGVSRWRSICA